MIDIVSEALSPEGTGSFPAVLPYDWIYIRDHWDELTGLPWWYNNSPDLEQQIAWRREAFAAIAQDWMGVPFSNSREHRKAREIRSDGETVSLHNRETGETTQLRRPAVSGWDQVSRRGYLGHVDNPPLSREEIDQVIPPVPGIQPEVIREAGHADLADRMLGEFPGLYPLYTVTSPLWACYYIWGYEQLMELVARQPDLVVYTCKRLLENEIENARLGAALGARGIWLEECLTDQIHPRDFRALNLPILQALVEEIHGLGMHSIYYFCGNPNDRLDLLLASGTDALALEESKKGFQINLESIAGYVDGRCALLGNLDAMDVLPNANEEELSAALECQAAAGRRNRNRFVFSLGSPVTPETSPERVRLFCEMARTL